MGQLLPNQVPVVVFRSHITRRVRLIADMLDARGLPVAVQEQGRERPAVVVAQPYAARARELLVCYGLGAEAD